MAATFDDDHSKPSSGQRHIAATLVGTGNGDLLTMVAPGGRKMVPSANIFGTSFQSEPERVGRKPRTVPRAQLRGFVFSEFLFI